MAALVAESSAKLPLPAFWRRANTSFSQSNRNGLLKQIQAKKRKPLTLYSAAYNNRNKLN